MLTQDDLSWKTIQAMSDLELIKLVERSQTDAQWTPGPSWFPGPDNKPEVYCAPFAQGDMADRLFLVQRVGYDQEGDYKQRLTAEYIVALHMSSHRLLALARKGLDAPVS